MSKNYFKRSGDTIVEDVFHFTDGNDIQKFKKQFAKDLDECIKVDDNGEELLYVMCNYHLMCRILNDFRDWNEYKKVGEELSKLDETPVVNNIEDAHKMVTDYFKTKQEKKADLFFNDSLGRELKVGDLVMLVDTKDLNEYNASYNDVMVVMRLVEVESNFIQFINIRTSQVIGCYAHRVLAFY